MQNYCMDSEYNVVCSIIQKGGQHIVSLTTVGFDIFVTESILPLLNAMTIVLANENQAKLQKELNTLLGTYPCEVLQTTPTRMKSLILDEEERTYLKKLKVILLGGEALDETLVEQLCSYTDADIYNIYGPTETTVWSTKASDISKIRGGGHMSKPIYQLNMLSPEERRWVIRSFNETQVPYGNRCIPEVFQELAVKDPHKIAVMACDVTLTYGELNAAANRIAHSLIAKGVKPGDIVAFILPRKSFLLAAMLGILKSGAAYLPIDLDYPQNRIDFLLADSGAKFCITEDTIGKLLANGNKADPDILIHADSCYCALHTSGSTGKPKLSALSHGNLINFLQGSARFFENVAVTVSATIVTFDAFILDTVVSLCIRRKPPRI